MKRATLIVTAAAIAAAGLLAATGTVAPAAGAGGELALTVQPVARTVKLGDDVALLLTVDNPTLDDVTLPELRLASDALSIRVRGAGIRPSSVTRLYGDFVEADGRELRLVMTPTRRQVVPAGGRLTREIHFAAVVPGTLELTASLACADQPSLDADPVEIEVTTPGGARRVVARIETTLGAFAVELDGAQAFNAVSQFWSLARSGFYGDLPVHRVVPGVLAQSGDPRGDGTGTAGWYLPAEARDEPLARGDVALARGAHPDSQSSQWFVTLADSERAAERLGGSYTPLGKVIEGLEVIDLLGAAPEARGEPTRVLRVRTSVR